MVSGRRVTADCHATTLAIHAKAPAMSTARRARHVLIAVAFGLAVLAVPRAEDIVANPPWGWHVPTESMAYVGMFVTPFGMVLLAMVFSYLPFLPPDGPMEVDEAYEWRVTAIIAAAFLLHVWALMPVFGIYLL